MFGQSFWAEMAHGGYTLVVIAISSLLAVAVAVERVVALWAVVPAAKALADDVARCLLRGDLTQARALCERSPSVAADVFLAGFGRQREASRSVLEAGVERKRVALVLELKRNLWILGTVGTISPFVGLFGTVIGIRNAFAAMAAAGTGGFAVVANGISEALVTTAAGILVAVEAVVLYNFFQARLGRVAAELKLLADEFVELLAERSPALAAAPAEQAPAPARIEAG